jgi:hypothetical protein
MDEVGYSHGQSMLFGVEMMNDDEFLLECGLTPLLT